MTVIIFHLFCTLVSDLICVFLFSLILDNERWKQADVPTELQSLVDSLVDGKNQLICYLT